MKSNEMLTAAYLSKHVDEFGCAHIVISDGNVDDESIDWSLNCCATEVDDPDDPLAEGEGGRRFATSWLLAMKQLPEEDREWVWEHIR
jgi:hypothetical protein